jgi:hypothetical protein
MNLSDCSQARGAGNSVYQYARICNTSYLNVAFKPFTVQEGKIVDDALYPEKCKPEYHKYSIIIHGT